MWTRRTRTVARRGHQSIPPEHGQTAARDRKLFGSRRKHTEMCNNYMTTRAQSDDQRILYTVDEVCHLLAIGKTSLYSLISTGVIHSVKLGRSRRIPRSALGDLLGDSALSEHPNLVTNTVGDHASRVRSI